MWRVATVFIVMRDNAIIAQVLYILPQVAKSISAMTRTVCSTMAMKDARVRMMKSTKSAAKLLPKGTREKRELEDLKGMEMIMIWRVIARSNCSREGLKGMITLRSRRK
jgi:hypothetical protein